MSTNKTPNYQLHRWTPEDEFHLTEINENFTKLDTAVKAEATAAAQARSGLADALGAAQSLLAGYNVSGQLIDPQQNLDIDLGFPPKLVILFSPAGHGLFFITPVGATYQGCRSQTTAETCFNYFQYLSLTQTGFHIEKGTFYLSGTAEKPAYYVAFR